MLCRQQKAGCGCTNLFLPSSAGFPVRNSPPPALPGLVASRAVGLEGGDFECPDLGSVVSGACAFRDILSASFTCSSLLVGQCASVAVYANGTEGCGGSTLAVLKARRGGRGSVAHANLCRAHLCRGTAAWHGRGLHAPGLLWAENLCMSEPVPRPLLPKRRPSSRCSPTHSGRPRCTLFRCGMRCVAAPPALGAI